MSTKIINLFRKETKGYEGVISEIREINKYRKGYDETRKMLNKHHKDTFNKEIKPYIKGAIENLETMIKISDKRKYKLEKRAKKLENRYLERSNSLMNMEEIN